MRWRLLCLLLLFFNSLQGQQNDLYPDLFTTYFYSPSLVNPAYMEPEETVKLYSFYRHRLGPFQKIASYAFIFSKTFQREDRPAHEVRALFMNEKEGPYIGKPRGYFHYSISIPVAAATRVMAGAALGFVQVAYTAPSATAAGSFTSPDAAVGIMFRRKFLEGGFSMMQALNPFIHPLNAPVRLRRYGNLYLSGKRELSLYWTLSGNLLWQALPGIADAFNGTLSVTYHNRFSFGTGFGLKTGLQGFVSFTVPAGGDLIRISFSYNSPLLHSVNLPVSSVELSGGYGMR